MLKALISWRRKRFELLETADRTSSMAKGVDLQAVRLATRERYKAIADDLKPEAGIIEHRQQKKSAGWHGSEPAEY